jgi:hypothetical protein
MVLGTVLAVFDANVIVPLYLKTNMIKISIVFSFCKGEKINGRFYNNSYIAVTPSAELSENPYTKSGALPL